MSHESGSLPPHIEETLEVVGKLHADHEDSTSKLQRWINQVTALLSRPAFLACLTPAIGLWILANFAAQLAGLTPFDPPPFIWLTSVSTLAASLISVVILATQRHAGQVALHREQMVLEISMLNEQKSTKIIQLLEELRRDSPYIRDRVDSHAEALGTHSDPQIILDAIKKSTEPQTSDG